MKRLPPPNRQVHFSEVPSELLCALHRSAPSGLAPLILHCALLIAILSSCLSEPSHSSTTIEKTTESVIELTIQFDNSSDSRADDPNGSNTDLDVGDGVEAARMNENTIHNLNFFFYTSETDNGINSAADTRFLKKVYLKNLNKTSNRTTPSTEEHTDINEIHFFDNRCEVKIYVNDIDLPNLNNLHVGVVANAGDLTQRIETLGSLRSFSDDAIRTVRTSTQESNDVSSYDYFLMSNTYENEGKIKLKDSDGNLLNLFTGEICIQRAVARIDFAFNKASRTDKSVEIATQDWHTGKRDVAYLTYTTLDDLAEIRITHIIPVNAMQRPSYLFKAFADKTDPDESDALSFCKRETEFNHVIEPTTFIKKTESEWDIDGWYGMSARSALKSAWTNNEEIKKIPNIDDYALSRMPYFQCSETKLDTDYIMIVGYANENIQLPSDYNDNLKTGLLLQTQIIPKVFSDEDGNILSDVAYTDGDDVFCCKLIDGDSFSYIYFKDKETMDLYVRNNNTDFTNSKLLPIIYSGGTCWYDFPLCHYENDETAPMHFVTVRNNIYRVGVKFTGPGNIEPLYENDPKNVTALIFVRKWNLRVEKEPIDF